MIYCYKPNKKFGGFVASSNIVTTLFSYFDEHSIPCYPERHVVKISQGQALTCPWISRLKIDQIQYSNQTK